jgi:hypothetical protein
MMIYCRTIPEDYGTCWMAEVLEGDSLVLF